MCLAGWLRVRVEVRVGVRGVSTLGGRPSRVLDPGRVLAPARAFLLPGVVGAPSLDSKCGRAVIVGEANSSQVGPVRP